MSQKMTPEEAQAIVNLLKSSDFGIFMNMISDLGEEKVQLLVKKPDLPYADYIRGSAGGITDVIDRVAGASAFLEQFNKP